MDLNRLSATELSRRLNTGSITPLDIAEACLARIANRDDEIQAWAFLDRAQTLAAAGRLREDRRPGMLRGIPVGIKDVIDTSEQPTQYGSPIYASHRPRADAASVALLKRAGALILGKTVTTEFANISPTATRNPLDISYTPGGSSSGSAAAVADFMVPIALGTQTAGSTIRPAAYCGVFAIKPSFGTINRAGLKFLAESLDTIGIFSRDPNDLALVLNVLSARPTVEIPSSAKPRIGIFRTEFWKGADNATCANLENAFAKLAAAGARISLCEAPSELAELSEQHKSVMGFESARALAWEVDHFPDLLSDALRARLVQGWLVEQAEYEEVRVSAARCRQVLAENMQDFDLLLAPSAPSEAPLASAGTGDSLFNRAWTLLGVPCLNVPFGTGPSGLPLGLQAIGRDGEDMNLIAWSKWVAEALRD